MAHNIWTKSFIALISDEKLPPYLKLIHISSLLLPTNENKWSYVYNMNYKVHFEDNKAVRSELVKDINDKADYAMVDNTRVIKSLVVNALSEKDALLIGNRLAEKLTMKP